MGEVQVRGVEVRKRSKYKPKGVLLDTMGWIKSGMQKVVDSEGGRTITQTRIKNHIAIEALRKGEATKDDISTLIEAFNVTEALAIKGIGAEYRAEIRAGQDAIYSIGTRAKKLGRFVIAGPELSAINTAMEIHDAQLDIATISELEAALDYVWQQVRLKKTRVIPSPV